MDSDDSPNRQRAVHEDRKFRVSHVTTLASIKIQGGKLNEQERKSCGCSSDCGKNAHS